MYIYFLIMMAAFFLSGVLSKVYCKDTKFTNFGKFIINIFIFLILLLPMGLRYGIGTDYFYTYYPYFNFIGHGTRYFDEVGFNLLNIIVYKLFGRFEMLIFITSFIFIYFMYKGILNNLNEKERPWGTLMLFLSQAYFYSMNMVRQSLAISIIFFAFKFLKSKEYKKYYMWNLIACTLHYSAIICLLFPLFLKIKPKKKTKLVIISILILCQPFLSKVLLKIIMSTKYSWYIGSRYTHGISNTVILVNIVLFILSILYEDKNSTSEEYMILNTINYICICLMLLLGWIPLFNRIIRYFTVFQVLLVPKIIYSETNSKKRLVLKCLLFLIFFVPMYYQIFLLGGEGVIPYSSIFNKS